MQIAALVLGILSMIGMFIALLPFLGWMNWLNIPFGVVGLIIGIIAIVTRTENRGQSIAGIVLCAVAVLGGVIRLIIGGGIL